MEVRLSHTVLRTTLAAHSIELKVHNAQCTINGLRLRLGRMWGYNMSKNAWPRGLGKGKIIMKGEQY